MRKSFFIVMAAVMFFTVNQASAQFEGEQMMPPQRMGTDFGGSGGHRGPHMDSEQMIKANVARLTKQLQLTQEQSAEVEKIYRDQSEVRKTRREQMRKEGLRPDMQAMRAQMEKERADMDAKMEKVLTLEQYAKYKEMQAARENNRMERGGREYGKQRGPAAHGNRGGVKPERNSDAELEKMKAELGLTDEQVAKMKQLMDAQKEQRREDMKNRKSEMEKRRSEMQQRRAENDAALKEILTPEQYEKMQQMKKGPGKKPAQNNR